MNMKEIICFTDGASRGNPGPGGYGAIMVAGEEVTEIGGAKDPTTNNEMELKAVVEVLKLVAGGSPAVTIYTDSKYVVEGATGWVFGWMKNGWQTKNKTEVLNKGLWQELLTVMKDKDITWKKIPGHVDLIGNERADVIASVYAKGEEPGLYQGLKAEYNIDIDNVCYDEEKAVERSAARERSRQKAYSYVSLADGVVKTHATWGECEARVKGRPAKFKKAISAAEETEIIADFENS